MSAGGPTASPGAWPPPRACSCWKLVMPELLLLWGGEGLCRCGSSVKRLLLWRKRLPPGQGGLTDRPSEGRGTPPLRCSGSEGPQEPCRTEATAGHRTGAVGRPAENRVGTGARCCPAPGRAAHPGFPAPPRIPAVTLPHSPSGWGPVGLCWPWPPSPT